MKRYITSMLALLLGLAVQASAMVAPLPQSSLDLSSEISQPIFPAAEEDTYLLVYVYDSENPYNGVFCIVQPPLGLAAYFFGGTGNNEDDDGFSNIEILRKAWDNDAGHGKGFYVSGVGSGYAPDNTSYWGLIRSRPLTQGAFGKTLGDRAGEMMDVLRAQLQNGDKEVNVFGFSRGAVTALEFLNRIQDEMNDPRNAELYKGIKINMVALIDPVSHTAKKYRTELPVNMKFEHAPLQFVAMDERRKQFSGKNAINLDPKRSIKIGYRGVHADVGAGYRDNPFSAKPLDDITYLAHLADMDVFKKSVIDYYKQEYKLINYWGRPDATPTYNDKWYYTLGQRKLPSEMYLSPSVFRFTAPLENEIDLKKHKVFGLPEAYRWAGKYYPENL